MSPLNRTILVRSICTGNTNVIAISLEESSNFRIAIQFSSLVKNDIFVRALGVMGIKEMSEPVYRGSLRNSCVSMVASRKMVNHNDPTGLTMNTCVIILTRFVFGFKAREGEVDG